jgi:hypothetical protein
MLDCRMVSSVIVAILMVRMVKSVTVCVTYRVPVVIKGTGVVAQDTMQSGGLGKANVNVKLTGLGLSALYAVVIIVINFLTHANIYK